MPTIVRFRTAEGDYAVEVGQVKEVRSATGLAPLPSPLPGVAGLMRLSNGRSHGNSNGDGDGDGYGNDDGDGDGYGYGNGFGDGDGDGYGYGKSNEDGAGALPVMALPVLAILGARGRHVVIIEKGPISFGLLVEEVTGVLQVDEGQIGAPPAGQDGSLVSGVLHDERGLVMLLDIDAIAGKLHP